MPERICIVPRVSGVGGMVSFLHKFSVGVQARGVQVTNELSDTPYGAILVIEQFLNPHVNQRGDGYGVSSAGRNRFALEVARAAAAAIGAERVGMRLSPHGVFNGTGAFADVQAQYLDLVQELSALGLLYLHLLDHSAMGAPAVPQELKALLRSAFKGPFILAGGFDGASAEAALAAGQADLIAFGRPFLCNPDLVQRMRSHAALNQPDMSTFYTPGAQGYTDYPTL